MIFSFEVSGNLSKDRLIGKGGFGQVEVATF